MFVKVESNGLTEYNGLIKVFFGMYFDINDVEYSKYAVIRGATTIVNPFKVQIIYVNSELTETEIMDIGEAFLILAYSDLNGISSQKLPDTFLDSLDVLEIKREKCLEKIAELELSHDLRRDIPTEAV